MNSLIQSQADRLPEAQYGRVAGMTGFVQMAAPVVGVGLAASFVGNNYLVFLVPGAVGVFALCAGSCSSRNGTRAARSSPTR